MSRAGRSNGQLPTLCIVEHFLRTIITALFNTTIFVTMHTLDVPTMTKTSKRHTSLTEQQGLSV